MAPVWLITGASKGIGFVLAQKVLESGHRVIGTIRNPSANADAVATLESKGGKVIELELGDAQASIHAKIRAAEQIYGQIDILVNNAGFSELGTIEDVTEKEIANLMATNVNGPIFTTQAMLPGMRARKSGLIINVSSLMGIAGMPGGSIYAATKFAIEGITECLAEELAPFNIDVLCVAPGLFYTGAVAATKFHVAPEYEGTAVAGVRDMVAGIDKSQASDPAKAANRIFDYVAGQGAAGALKGKTRRLLLGPDCIQGVEKKIETLKADLELSRPIGISTRFDS
ncbi:hypothetical protein BROUX41_005161 [Berkeleyomyces rouxiae]|uniref:uncharacterized protein n=1 Tax=Berkeleyomyces rouxiae TaxID=2035830 RepID=UPI003B7B6876